MVVTYHPDAELAARVRMLVGQVAAILIIDNGSTDDELSPVRELVAAGVARSILNDRNLGLAAALNQGLTWGEERGFAWVATFDQDSTPGPNLVIEAGRVYEARSSVAVAVIGAGWTTQIGRGADCGSPDGIEATHVITSGALHHVGLWRALGGFRDDFFIDYVDTEYCLRARAAGYVIAQTCVPTMTHAIGSPTRRRMLIRSVTPSNHNRIRRFYITRNRMYVWRSVWRREPGYVAYDMKAAAKELVKMLLFEDDRVAKVRAILAGMRDSTRMPSRTR